MTTGSGTDPHGSRGSHGRSGAAGNGGQRATVIEKLANGMFRLQMTDGREVVGHAAQDLRMALSRLLTGDQVLAELSPFDPNKARICKLLKSSQPSQQPNPSSNPPKSSNSQQRELP
jgi:translation initiation factor IF-1